MITNIHIVNEALKLTCMKQATEEAVTRNIYRLVYLIVVFICVKV